jgi:hypothetical protein
MIVSFDGYLLAQKGSTRSFDPWEERKHVAGHLMHDATVEEWLDSVKKRLKPGDTRVIK